MNGRWHAGPGPHRGPRRREASGSNVRPWSARARVDRVRTDERTVTTAVVAAVAAGEQVRRSHHIQPRVRIEVARIATSHGGVVGLHDPVESGLVRRKPAPMGTLQRIGSARFGHRFDASWRAMAAPLPWSVAVTHPRLGTRHLTASPGAGRMTCGISHKAVAELWFPGLSRAADSGDGTVNRGGDGV